jgi:hypothetical protein
MFITIFKLENSKVGLILFIRHTIPLKAAVSILSPTCERRSFEIFLSNCVRISFEILVDIQRTIRCYTSDPEGKPLQNTSLTFVMTVLPNAENYRNCIEIARKVFTGGSKNTLKTIYTVSYIIKTKPNPLA